MRIHECLKDQSDEIKETFLKQAVQTIADDAHLYSTMLPTVCFYNEYKFGSTEIHGLIESKLHLRETTWIVLKVSDQLDEFMKSLDQLSKAENDDKISSPDVIEMYLEAAEMSLEEEMDSSSSEASNSTGKSLTNTEIELLMKNFDELTSDEQKNLLKHLFNIKNCEPERFKMLKSPF